MANKCSLVLQWIAKRKKIRFPRDIFLSSYFQSRIIQTERGRERERERDIHTQSFGLNYQEPHSGIIRHTSLADALIRNSKTNSQPIKSCSLPILRSTDGRSVKLCFIPKYPISPRLNVIARTLERQPASSSNIFFYFSIFLFPCSFFAFLKTFHTRIDAKLWDSELSAERTVR